MCKLNSPIDPSNSLFQQGFCVFTAIIQLVLEEHSSSSTDEPGEVYSFFNAVIGHHLNTDTKSTSLNFRDIVFAATRLSDNIRLCHSKCFTCLPHPLCYSLGRSERDNSCCLGVSALGWLFGGCSQNGYLCNTERQPLPDTFVATLAMS